MKNSVQFSRTHRRLTACICISIGALSAATITAKAQSTTPLSMQPLSLYIPTNTPGFDAEHGTNRLDVTGWLNTNSVLVVTATNISPTAYSNVAPFAVFQRLLQAYQTADVQAVQALYDPTSSQTIAAVLSDPEARTRWSQFVTNVQAIVPLVIWNETNQIGAITWSLQGIPTPTGSNSSLFPIVFDTNFVLKAGSLASSAANCLSIYFANGARSPDGLLTNTLMTNSVRSK